MLGLETILQKPGTGIGAPFEKSEVEDMPDNCCDGKDCELERRNDSGTGTACFAQLVDNIWMSSINIAVPRIAQEFDLHDVLAHLCLHSNLWWLSFSSLVFFLTASGAVRCSLVCIIFRALQGLGAAASVPSAIGVLSNYFVGNEKHRALIGLILGGILSGTVGWRFIFYINAPLIGILAISGWFSFPQEHRKNKGRKPSLDLLGAGLGTSLKFSGWNKPIVVATLIVSILVLLGFAWAERKVPNPIMCSLPHLFSSLPSQEFGVLVSFFTAGEASIFVRWASVIYYLSLIAQEVLFLTPLNTGLYMIPMGLWGFVACIATGRAVERFELKPMLVIGFFICCVGTLPAAFRKSWLLFPTTIICGTGISIAYNVASIALVSAVPRSQSPLAGGLINTAFQTGAGFGIAITSVVFENVLKSSQIRQILRVL
ncbi:major facilitator superfamily domain-containing protein [Rhodocollybia butyracea]|uniref:Major facilitator superfamily domain-containing protein n=1 Tax=Rhodocollybia butyracea TaxID=206335 RepID=A0A9P5P6T3_9AGAR|nr:major facilitator superfamily domain-containing protein [Rhodocollybia butyracea]